MGFLHSILGKSKRGPRLNPIRETLFGDLPLNQWPVRSNASNEFPWGAFLSARLRRDSGAEAEAVSEWRSIIAHPGLESRHYLQAWHFLRQHGQQPGPDIAKQVLGVVIEVAMAEGLDLLAAYADCSARYYNYSGAGVVWEHPDTSLNAAIGQLLVAGSQVVARIGPWDDNRPDVPPIGHARMSFLTPSGLHFGQGPMDLLACDPIGGHVIQLGTKLMQMLIAKERRS